MTSEDIAEVAVVGIPDTLKGQIPLGLCVLKHGINIDLLSQSSSQKMFLCQLVIISALNASFQKHNKGEIEKTKVEGYVRVIPDSVILDSFLIINHLIMFAQI